MATPRSEFWESYESLLDEGLILTLSGPEYSRLEREWLAFGSPPICELFILARIREEFVKKPTESD